jgi:hypothetical protein
MPQAPSGPLGLYQPEVLMLAPESGEDANTLSLVAQLLELGVAVELDERWRLPVRPPRDLSAYKVCLFPETARAAYDKDLDAFYRGGGFLPYFKYYPVMAGPSSANVHYKFFESFGRDAYCWHAANCLLEGGVRPANPDFARAMEARPDASVLADVREQFFARFAAVQPGKWADWKDPDCIYLYMNLTCAEKSGDAQWMALVRRCLDNVRQSRADLLRGGIEMQLDGVVETYVLMFGGLLMHAGARFGDARLTEAGAELGMRWFRYYHRKPGLILAPFERFIWSEFACRVGPLYQLARATGDPAVLRYADDNTEQIAAATLRDDGLWAHWADAAGARGTAWSRGTSWPVHGLAKGLCALDPADARAARIRDLLQRTYDGVMRRQHPATGLWHLVLDEPATRCESSASAAFVYYHDRLRELGAFDDRHDAAIERAFAGLKRICYRHGVAGCCRGTSVGVPDYYRTRPMGFSPASTHFGGAVAARVKRSSS